jgi:hypothetical protein
LQAVTKSKFIEIGAKLSPRLKRYSFKKYDYVYLESAKNPFGIAPNFRPNKCFGYLKDYYPSGLPYSISYSKICPRIDATAICNLSNKCQDFLFRIQGSCTAIDYTKNQSTAAIGFEPACQTFIDNYVSQLAEQWQVT